MHLIAINLKDNHHHKDTHNFYSLSKELIDDRKFTRKIPPQNDPKRSKSTGPLPPSAGSAIIFGLPKEVVKINSLNLLDSER
jgi:hypothetical protein